MTSKTYTCFACQKAGSSQQVVLDGKDEHGKTVYLNTDGSSHIHVRSASKKETVKNDKEIREMFDEKQKGFDKSLVQRKIYNALYERYVIAYERYVTAYEEEVRIKRERPQ